MLIPAATNTRSPAPIPIDSLKVVEPAALVCREAPIEPEAPVVELVSSAKGTTVTEVIVLTAPLENVSVKISVDVEEEIGLSVVVVLDLPVVLAVESFVFVWVVDLAVVWAVDGVVEVILANELVVEISDVDDGEVVSLRVLVVGVKEVDIATVTEVAVDAEAAVEELGSVDADVLGAADTDVDAGVAELTIEVVEAD